MITQLCRVCLACPGKEVQDIQTHDFHKFPVLYESWIQRVGPMWFQKGDLYPWILDFPQRPIPQNSHFVHADPLLYTHHNISNCVICRDFSWFPYFFSFPLQRYSILANCPSFGGTQGHPSFWSKWVIRFSHHVFLCCKNLCVEMYRKFRNVSSFFNIFSFFFVPFSEIW